MIFWFTILTVAVATVSGLISLVAGLFGRRPGDVTVLSLVLVEVLLIVQVVIAIIAPFAGNPPTGSLLEFWTYLISALLLPAAGVGWALVDRTRWSVVIMGVLGLSVAIMVYRMQVIWAVQLA